MPNASGRFHLYSDTSKICNWKCTVPNTEWQTQDDSLCQQKIARSCKNYSIIELAAMWISHKHSKFLSLVKES